MYDNPHTHWYKPTVLPKPEFARLFYALFGKESTGNKLTPAAEIVVASPEREKAPLIILRSTTSWMRTRSGFTRPRRRCGRTLAGWTGSSEELASLTLSSSVVDTVPCSISLTIRPQGSSLPSFTPPGRSSTRCVTALLLSST